MTSSKLQLKAELFKIIAPIRNIGAADDKIITNTIENIRNIKDVDFDFCSKLLIKEIDPNNSKSSVVFLYAVQNLSPKKFLGFIIEELKSKDVSDEKKFFLINLLSGFGINFTTDEIEFYLKNPDEAINNETLKFLNSAVINPEVQIDFLDFYYSSDKSDRKEILNTVFGDFSEEKVLNIVIGLILSVQDEDIILYCLEYLKKLKTPLLKRPLEYLKISKNLKVSNKANKLYRKMSMQGLFDKKESKDFYLKIFADFEEPKIYFSYPDGNSNFSAVVSRENRNGYFNLLFIALNINLGIFSCFGFSNLSKDDYNTILDRFFGESSRILVENSIGKKILFDFTKKRILSDKIVPYEYYCWERCIEDIEITDLTYEEILISNVKKVKLDDFSKKCLLNSIYVRDWFYKNSKHNIEYSSFVDEVEKLEEDKIFEIEGYLNKYSKNKTLITLLKERIKFLAFCLMSDNKQELANMYYSSLFDEEFLSKFVSNLLKRSIYEHYMKIKNIKKINKNIKTSVTKNQNEDLFILYAKENWMVN